MVSWDTRMLSSSGYCVFSHPEICSGALLSKTAIQ
jgi:hypothetical protein